jgi:dTDP-4-dehydrorhamnose reductase
MSEKIDRTPLRIVVTGSSGFVAGHIRALASPDLEVHGLTRVLPDAINGQSNLHATDLLDPARLAESLDGISPHAVIHTAAMANIDTCQTEPDKARQANVESTRNLAKLCADRGIRLVFCSTDSIFDGKKGHYTESDAPNPLNTYAETKVEAERIVTEASPGNAIARLSLVMGIPVHGKGNAFLNDMIHKLGRLEPMNFPQNEIRTPVDVITLAEALVELATLDLSGIIHLSGNTRLNRYDMALRIADALGLPAEAKALIRGTDSNAIPGRALRPNDASLDNSKARKLLHTPMLDLEDGLTRVLKDHKSN